jgi:PAS domain S-box-containing protein
MALLSATFGLMHSLTSGFAAGLFRVEQQAHTADELASLSIALRDAERAQMTFLLTGSEPAWAQFESEATRISEQFEALRGGAGANSELNARLMEIEPALGAALSHMETVMRQRRTYGSAVQQGNEMATARDGVDEVVHSLLAAQRQVTSATRSRMASDIASGIRRELLAFAILLLVSSGTAFWFVSLRRECVLTRQSAREIEAKAETWGAIFNSIPTPIAIAGEQRRMIACNTAFERLLMWSSTDLADQDLNEFAVPTPLRIEAAEHAEHVLAGTTRCLMTRRVRKGGNPVEVLMKSAPLVVNGSAAGIVNLYLEPADQKIRQLESAANTASDQRDAAIEEKNRLASDLVTVLGRPLKELRSTARLLNDGEESAHAARLQQALQAVDVMSATVQQLSDLQQAERGKLYLQRIEFNVREVVSSSLPSAIDPNVPERLIGDPLRLRQVIEILGQAGTQSTGKAALCVELESNNGSQVCLHFSFAGDLGPDVDSASVARRLALKLLALMGGRIWGDVQSRAGLQFHAVFSLPHTKPMPLASERSSTLAASATRRLYS